MTEPTDRILAPTSTPQPEQDRRSGEAREPGESRRVAPVLVVGGTGVVGTRVLRWLRRRHPHLPVVVGGRDLDRARAAAEAINNIDAVAIDLDQAGLGLTAGTELGAVVMLAPDAALLGLRLAQDHGVPYLNIGNGLVDLGPELALFAHRAEAAPVVLASHWMGGAATFLALEACAGFKAIDTIRIGALIDEEDDAGPLSLDDMERLQRDAPAAFVIADGRRAWVSGDAAIGEIETVDGRTLAAEAYAPLDVISLHAATGAGNIRFDLASGISSSRHRGSGVSTEILVEVTGTTAAGTSKKSSSSLEFGEGQASLTGLCVALSLEAVLGLESDRARDAGLYLPELLISPERATRELLDAGAVIERTG